jgi:hypothetical protein
LDDLELELPDDDFDDGADGDDVEPGEHGALVVDRERKRIADLLEREGSPRSERLAERLRGCGRYRFGLVRCDEEARSVAGSRSLVLGCKLRICPACNAWRRARFDRQLRPQLQALTDLGHELLFATLTTRTVAEADAQLGALMRARVDAVAGMRRGRKRWKRWTAMVAGGLTGVEVTLYKRDKATDDIVRRADGSLDRRLHAHIHMVVVLQRGVDAEAACGVLVKWWREEARARGWVTSLDAQKVERVTADRLTDDRNPANYCVKYVGKPADLVTPLDAFTMQSACKGLRQVNTFGVLHGAALRGAVAAARTVGDQLELELDADPRPAARFRALEAGDDERDCREWAADVERSNGAAAAQPWRVVAKDAAWRRAIRERQLELALGGVWRDAVEGIVAPQEAEREERAAAALDRAAAGAERRSAWVQRLAERGESAEQRGDDAVERARVKVGRAERALQERERIALQAQDRAEVADELPEGERERRQARHASTLAALREAEATLERRRARLAELEEATAQAGAKRMQRRLAALEKLEAAEAYRGSLQGRVRRPRVAEAEARAVVAVERARQAVERERWHVAVVDDVAPSALAGVEADDEHQETQRYGNLWRIERRAAGLAWQARSTASAARLRYSRSVARDRRAVICREILRRRRRMLPPSEPQDDARRTQILLDALRQAAELACTADNARRGAPLTLAALERAANAGDERASAWIAQMRAGDAERQAAARKRREKRNGDMQGVRKGVRAHQRAASAQQELRGLGSVRRRAG